tara:strand:- start:1241 stop:1681 length:441 start_codon:yes stop_codon:yes gene_type:complete
MATEKPFPRIKPTSRSYSPGTYPSTDFESLDGTKTHLRFGNRRVNATLQLGFSNISDQEAALIIENYEDVNATWDYVTFTSSDGVSGVSNSKQVDGQTNPASSLQSLVKEGGAGLLWRYSGPPTVTSTFKGLSNVSCSFVACLDSP